MRAYTELLSVAALSWSLCFGTLVHKSSTTPWVTFWEDKSESCRESYDLIEYLTLWILFYRSAFCYCSWKSPFANEKCSINTVECYLSNDVQNVSIAQRTKLVTRYMIKVQLCGMAHFRIASCILYYCIKSQCCQSTQESYLSESKGYHVRILEW